MGGVGRVGRWRAGGSRIGVDGLGVGCRGSRSGLWVLVRRGSIFT